MKMGILLLILRHKKLIIRKKYEQLSTNKFNALDEMHKFLETQNLLKLNHKEIYNLNRPVSNKDIKSVFKFIS